MKFPIYMDHHSTTPCDRRVLEKMLPYFSEQFGNPAATHRLGQDAREVVESARVSVAGFVSADPSEIIFTGGATESNNIAIQGVAWAYREKGNHVVTGPTEHKSVLETCRSLRSEGFEVTELPVDRQGRVDPASLEAAITERTILISLMAANNEVGTLHPVREIVAIAKKREILFHCDAVQAAGKIPVNVEELGIDLLSISGHKMYGPKGIGALYIRKKGPRVRLSPMIFGAGHERGLRSGTVNVPGIVGLGEACSLASREMADESSRIAKLRDRMKERVLSRLSGVHLNGHPTERLPNNLNFSFEGIDPVLLLPSFTDVCLSSGSSCTSTDRVPSFVLKAMGISDDLALSSIRLGLGKSTTEEEVDFAADRIVEVVTRLRKRGTV